MSKLYFWRSSTALFAALTLSTSAIVPVISAVPALAQSSTSQTQSSFTDVSSSYWAGGFIQELAKRQVISGFPDGSFRPDDPVTRAQFAAMVRKAFSRSNIRNPVSFRDVPNDYWAAAAIRDAYSTGFMSGYPEGVFLPEENIPRAQVLVSLANGLGYTTSSTSTALQSYNDAGSIPDWAKNSIAAATDRKIVVNYPNVQTLSPNRAATRAEVAAFIYQALVSAGQVSAIQSPYIVGQVTTPPTQAELPIGTKITTGYNDETERILISFEEPDPVPLTLIVDRDITQGNRIMIPRGSQVVGELQVLEDEGAQFYARELVLANGSKVPLKASSPVVTTTETVRRGSNVGEILLGTAVGAGAAAAIAAVTGDRAIATEEVLGGGAFGALASLFLGRNRVTLISVDPNTDLDLTLDSPLAMR